jgi:hypothetical protein
MRKYLLLLFFTLFTAGIAFAQVTTSSISGTVVDEKGVPLPGVTITATHTPTGTNYATVSRVDGRYNLPNLRVGGPYTVTFSFIGFTSSVQKDITLSLGQESKIGTKLLPTSRQLGEVASYKYTKQGNEQFKNRFSGNYYPFTN